MDIKDIIITPFFLLFIFFISFILRTKYEIGSPLRKYYFPAMWVKVLGAIAICFVYQFYYGSGDTIGFYEATKVFWAMLTHEPSSAIDLLFSTSLDLPDAFYKYDKWNAINMVVEPQSFFLIKMASIIGIITFDTYLPISIIFALISFTGIFALYKTFVDAYPSLSKELAIAILFVPSVVFWGSGLLKDTITLGSLGWLIFSFYQLFKKGEKIGFSIFMIILSAFLLIKIKAYIFMSVLPAMLFWLVSIYRSRIRLRFIRVLAGPIIIIIALGLNYSFISQFGESFGRFSPENLIGTAQGFQSWHTYVSDVTGGSGYSLGEYEQTTKGALIVFPKAVAVTLFRPFPWEVKNAVMLFSSIESTLILLFSIYVLLKLGVFRPFRILRIIYNNPDVFFCIFYSIFFAFAVGFSSYNFGALVRYKIPCIPLYLTGLIIILHIAKNENKKRQLKGKSIY